MAQRSQTRRGFLTAQKIIDENTPMLLALGCFVYTLQLPFIRKAVISLVADDKMVQNGNIQGFASFL